MIKPFNNAITPEQMRRAAIETAVQQDFEALSKLKGHRALTDIALALHTLAFDGDGCPDFDDLQVNEMQHALILLRVCSVALGEIERAAHGSLETMRDFAQNEITQLDALKMEFVEF